MKTESRKSGNYDNVLVVLSLNMNTWKLVEVNLYHNWVVCILKINESVKNKFYAQAIRINKCQIWLQNASRVVDILDLLRLAQTGETCTDR